MPTLQVVILIFCCVVWTVPYVKFVQRQLLSKPHAIFTQKKKTKKPHAINDTLHLYISTTFIFPQMVEDGIIFPMGHGYPGRGKEPYAHWHCAF